MKRILVTHTDLDGVGSEVLMRKMYGEDLIEVIVADYKNVNDKIINALNKYDNAEEVSILITDLRPNNEVAELLQKRHEVMVGSVLMLDHHRTALELCEKYQWAIVELNSCATKMLFDLVIETSQISNYDKVKDYYDFVTIVNDYDMWLHNFKRSKMFNDLYYLIGRERFVNRMLEDYYMTLTTTEEIILDVEYDRKQRYFEEMKEKVKILITDDDFDYNLPYVVAEQYISDLAHYLMEELNTDVVAIVNPKDMKVSLRSRNDFICRPIAENFGGGGHDLACGFQIDEFDLHNFVGDIFYKLV